MPSERCLEPQGETTQTSGPTEIGRSDQFKSSVKKRTLNFRKNMSGEVDYMRYNIAESSGFFVPGSAQERNRLWEDDGRCEWSEPSFRCEAGVKLDVIAATPATVIESASPGLNAPHSVANRGSHGVPRSKFHHQGSDDSHHIERSISFGQSHFRSNRQGEKRSRFGGNVTLNPPFGRHEKYWTKSMAKSC